MTKVNKLDQFFIDHESSLTKCMLAVSFGICVAIYPEIASASTDNDLLKSAMDGAGDTVGVKTKVTDTFSGSFGWLVIISSCVWTALLNSTTLNPKTWPIPFVTSGIVKYAPGIMNSAFTLTV